MTHRLGDLMSEDWRPLWELQPDSVSRVAALGAELMSAGCVPDRLAGVFFVPGRIEVLGKHTDYAGGRSLVTATEQGIFMVSCPRQDTMIRMLDAGRGQAVEFELDSPLPNEVESWTLYPRTVARRLVQAVDRSLVGADVVFESNLPASAGLSSSSVLVIATFLALQRCNDLDLDPRFKTALQSREDLAAFLGAVETGRPFGPFQAGDGVGARGGDQDHTAILCAAQGEIRQYRFLPTVRERTLSMPRDFVFALAVSGVQAEKTGAARVDYNRVSDLAARLEEVWRTSSSGTSATLGSIVRLSPGGIASLESALEKSHVEPRERRDLKRRLSQFQQETEEIIPSAGDALALGDLAAFGHWVDKSMRLAIELLGNQIEETVRLTAAARDLSAVAASAFGAGFGGAVWALVREDEVGGFLDRWSRGYLDEFPERQNEAQFLSTVAGGPATEL